jgi:prepilin-type N-terminal cleavage/methylation domain-containing protein
MIKQFMRKGFTLIEIIVVIAILSIISGIAIPAVFRFIDNARIAADQANLQTLNSATIVYSYDIKVINNDIFAGIQLDNERMQQLVAHKTLESAIIPLQRNAQFCWNVNNQIWLNSLLEVAEKSWTSYLFGSMNLNDYRKTYTWSKSDAGFYSNYGLLFIDNNRSAYEIVTKAKLGAGDYSAGTSGGFGILFDTSLTNDNKDTGYILQIDRGFGGVIIRKRENGSEKSPILTIKNAQNSLIPSNKTDAWWTTEHEIKLQVDNVAGQNGKKTLTITIDNTQIVDSFAFDSSIDAANSFTGFRSWQAGTTYKELSIQ